MQKLMSSSGSVTAKALIVGVIILVLLIPLSMLRTLVRERAEMRTAAYDKVAAGWGGHVTVPGPILIIPTHRDVLKDGKTETLQTDAYFLPSDLTFAVDIRMQPQPRRVGIYEVPVYLADVRLRGTLNVATIARWQQARPGHRLQWQLARVLLPMQETRELRAVRTASFAGRALRFVPARVGTLKGIEAQLAWDQMPAEAMQFDMQLLLAGSGSLAVLPLGGQTSATIAADWPHPSFSGAFSPTRYTVDAQGFDAQWSVLELNRSYGSAWLDGEVAAETVMQSGTGVHLFQSVDIYQRGERATKYALVFIALTFLTFFAWEQVSDIRLHPLQYLLIGLALSVFYLLLVAFTEHLSFGVAYGIAAAALVALIGLYVAGALRSARRGAAVAAAIAATYGFLYGLVLSEDHALLMGSIAVFAALAAVMLITRRIDWYGTA